MSRKNRRRTAPDKTVKTLKLTADPPVVIIRSKFPSDSFQYTTEEWVRVVGARRRWPASANLGRVMAELEAAGQRYHEAIKSRPNRLALKHARAVPEVEEARTELIKTAIRIWKATIGDAEFSRPHGGGVPGGQLIRFLTAALDPILKTDNVSAETLARIIIEVRQTEF